MIYICIPTHNEQQTVGVVLWKLRQVLTDFPREYQLLVADDASADKTPEVLEPYTRVLPLTVVRSDRRLGHGASLELLLREAVRRSEYPKRDVIVTLQADFSDEPDDIVPLIKRLEAGADVAVGNKVAKSKATRLRRFSLALARFFARGQKWPEGVETPFDGYRAYRVYAVKRAMETRDGRLIRHDGWAAHADLLRQVMPHARRVDALTVVDRTDRLQRPRRERPFAAALEVRSMTQGAAPANLVPVSELDSIVATASRSRDRAGSTYAVQNGRAATTRANGARSRSRDRDSATSRPRSQSGGVRPARGGRAQDATADAAGPRQRKSRSKPAQRRGQDDGKAAEGKVAENAAAAAAATGVVGAAADVEAAVASVAGESAVPKKKRRRRRRSGSSAARGAASSGEATGDAGSDAGVDVAHDVASVANHASNAGNDAPGAADDASGAESNEADAEPRKRRRGGRRGGRGRRRTPRADGAQGAEGAEGAEGAVTESRVVEPTSSPDRTTAQAQEPNERAE